MASPQNVARHPLPDQGCAMTTLTPTTDAVDSDLDAFFAAMGWDGGRVEVVAGTNQADNPDKIDLLIHIGKGKTGTRRWIDPDDPAALKNRISYLAARYGNVYVSVGTYGPTANPYKPGELRYSRDQPLSRRCFILDDVTDLSALRLHPTWANETSPGNYQVGYTCIELLSPKQAEKLGEGAMLLARTDASGWDATQIIRLPGTLNTKPKCVGRAGDPKAGIEPEGWTVRLVFADGPRYTHQQLATAFLPGGMTELHRGASRAQQTAGDGPVGDVGQGDEAWRKQDWRGALEAQAARWRPLVRAGRGGLLADEGHPRGFTNPKATARQVWSGTSAGDESRDIFIVGKGLLMHGYDDAQAFALLEHFAYTHRSHYVQRGAAQVVVDICRVLCRVDAELGNRRKVRQAELPTDTQPQAGPTTPRTRPKRGPKHGGRNAQVTELHSILAALPSDADGWGHTNRTALSKALSVSVWSVATYLVDLRTQGWDIRTEVVGIAVKLVAAPDVNSLTPLGYLSADTPDVNSLTPLGCTLTNGIGMPNSNRVVYGDHTPPFFPALPACSGVADEPLSAVEPMARTAVALLPAQPASVDATLYVDHGTLVGEPDAMDEAAWMNLMAQRSPIGELLDPGAIAAWVVDGLCDVPVEELPPSECVDNAIVAWIMDGLCEVPAEELPPSDCADDDEVITVDEARILAYPIQDAPRRPLYKVGSAMLTSQDGSGATEQPLPTLSPSMTLSPWRSPWNRPSVSPVRGCDTQRRCLVLVHRRRRRGIRSRDFFVQ